MSQIYPKQNIGKRIQRKMRIDAKIIKSITKEPWTGHLNRVTVKCDENCEREYIKEDEVIKACIKKNRSKYKKGL